MTASSRHSNIHRIGPYWRVRYPGSHFLLFKHQARAELAATLDEAEAAELEGCVGIENGRLVRARHLVDRWRPQRLFFVIGGEDVDASDSLDVTALIFVDRAGTKYPVGYPPCVDCGGRLEAKDARGEWIAVHDLERCLAHFGARGTDFAHGLRRCAECGSLFTDTRYGWGWSPVKAYVAPVRPSTLDTLSQIAAGCGILGPMGLSALWDLASWSWWWFTPLAAALFLGSIPLAAWLEDLSRDWDIERPALDSARRAADSREHGPREPNLLPLFDRVL